MKRIAVFGGSFDPVHCEHVRLAEEAVKSLALDRLFVMPAYAPPHKPWKNLSPDADRLETCRLAFAGFDKITVSDYEISQKGTSYTYLTCRYFKNLYPDATIFWLVGTDMLRDFPTWKNTADILENVTLAVCARNEDEGWLEKETAAFEARFGKRFAVINYNGKDVASTKLRVWLAAGEEACERAGVSLREVLPRAVCDYVKAKGLYEVAGTKEALALEKPERAAHSLRVAELAAVKANKMCLSERKAIQASLFHDCAKNLEESSAYLQGFEPPAKWGDISSPVWHQFASAYVAEKQFGVMDEEVLNAVRYHTSARPNMSEMEKLVFLADMLEDERKYKGVDELRALFWKDGLDECLQEALYQTLLFLEAKGGEVYPLTREAYEFYANENKKK